MPSVAPSRRQPYASTAPRSRSFAEMRNIDVWYTRLDLAGILERFRTASSGKQMKRLRANVVNVNTKDSLRALSKLCRRSTASYGSSATLRS